MVDVNPPSSYLIQRCQVPFVAISPVVELEYGCRQLVQKRLSEVASWFVSPEHASLAGVMGTSHVYGGCRHSWRPSGAGYQAVNWDESIQTDFFWRNSLHYSGPSLQEGH